MKTVKTIVTRAFVLSWNQKKMMLAFIALLGTGLIGTFCHVVTGYFWLNVGFSLLPFFLGGMLLMPLGILLVRLYHDEVKRGKASLAETLKFSWELMISSMYLMLPPLMGFLLLWAALGVATLLQEIPGLHVLLSFAPFLLLFSCLVLVVAVLFLLFIGPATLGLSDRKEVKKALGLFKRLKKDPLGNAAFFFLAIFPALLTLCFLVVTSKLMFPLELSTLGKLVQSLIIMIPFAALMTYPAVFFFSLSAEAHAYLER